MTIKHQFIAKVSQPLSENFKGYKYIVFKPGKIIQSDKTTIHKLPQALIFSFAGNMAIFEQQTEA